MASEKSLQMRFNARVDTPWREIKPNLPRELGDGVQVLSTLSQDGETTYLSRIDRPQIVNLTKLLLRRGRKRGRHVKYE